MKRLFNVIVLAMAANFLVAAGGVGWLYKSGHLDKPRLAEVKKVLFPPPATQPAADVAVAAAPTTRPADAAADEVGPNLDAVLAKAVGRPADQQVEVVRQAFDVQSAELDRRRRELVDLQRQLDTGRAEVARDRARIDADRKTFATSVADQGKLAGDKGFQDTLALYQVMPARQVKTIFMSLPEAAVEQYLQAMSPKTAAKITKEFKTPDEADRLQRVLERMRASTPPASPPPPASPQAAAR